MEKLTLQKFVEKLSKSVDLTSFDLVKYYQHEKQQIVITIEVDFESCHDIWRLKSAKVQRNEDENQKVLSTSFHEKIAKFASEIAKCRQREVERFCQQLLRRISWSYHVEYENLTCKLTTTKKKERKKFVKNHFAASRCQEE